MARESLYPKLNKEVEVKADCAMSSSVTSYVLTPEEMEKQFGPKVPAKPPVASGKPSKKHQGQATGPEEARMLEELFPELEYTDSEWGGPFLDEEYVEEDLS